MSKKYSRHFSESGLWTQLCHSVSNFGHNTTITEWWTIRLTDNSSRELVYTSTYVLPKTSELSRSAELLLAIRRIIYDENIVGSGKIEDVHLYYNTSGAFQTRWKHLGYFRGWFLNRFNRNDVIKYATNKCECQYLLNLSTMI